MKVCGRCKVPKPLLLMKRDKRNGDGFSSFCKECHKAASVAWQKANPDKLNAGRRARYQRKNAEINEARRDAYDYDKVRFERIKYNYKVTREWYEQTMEAQGGVCAICKRPQSDFNRAFAVDHNHACCPTTPTCGKCNRGILCHSCNVTIHAMDRDRDLNWFVNAITYLGL